MDKTFLQAKSRVGVLLSLSRIGRSCETTSVCNSDRSEEVWPSDSSRGRTIYSYVSSLSADKGRHELNLPWLGTHINYGPCQQSRLQLFEK